MVRNSERALWLKCRQAHHWAYRDNLKANVSAPALRFGTLIHKALETRYPKGVKRGPHPTRAFKKLYDAELDKAMGFGFRDEDGTWQDARDVGIAMLNLYVETYGKDSNYEVIASEQTFRTPIRYKGRTIAMYVGTFDGIWKDRTKRRLLIKDFKTTGKDPTRQPHLVLDEQASSYMTFGASYLIAEGILKPGALPNHMLYTFMKKQLPDLRPKNAEGLSLNQNGSVSKDQRGPMIHREPVYRDDETRKIFADRVATEIHEMQGAPVYKAPGYFTCMGCEFADMCELHESGADWQSLRRVAYQAWDPYADHEVYEDGK